MAVMSCFNCVKYNTIAYLVIAVAAEMSIFGLSLCAPHTFRDIVNKLSGHDNSEGDSKYNCVTTVDCVLCRQYETNRNVCGHRLNDELRCFGRRDQKQFVNYGYHHRVFIYGGMVQHYGRKRWSLCNLLLLLFDVLISEIGNRYQAEQAAASVRQIVHHRADVCHQHLSVDGCSCRTHIHRIACVRL